MQKFIPALALISPLAFLLSACQQNLTGHPDVTVSETTQQQTFLNATYQDHRFYPVVPDDLKEARQQLKAIEKPLMKAWNETHAEELADIKSRLKVKDTATYRLAWMERKQYLLRAKAHFASTNGEYKAALKAYEKLSPTLYTEEVREFPYITLNNGLIKISIAPTIGMRIFNAVDLTTGRSIAGSEDPEFLEKDKLLNSTGWFAGYSEASFPMPEHGTTLDNPAGWRIIEHEDGSVTVAMNMRFTSYQHLRHQNRYGQYAQRHVSQWITLKPGESKYTVTYRVDNPTGTRRSDRIWVNHVMYAKDYDRDHLIFPAGYIMFHQSRWTEDFSKLTEQQKYLDVSWFALKPDYDFCGVYDPQHDANSLVIKDRQDPGMKLYTPAQHKDGFLEFWIGTTHVFEDGGQLLPPYEATTMTTTHYVAGGIGQVDYANQHIAVAFDEGTFKITGPKAADLTVTNFYGVQLASGKIAPGKVLTGQGENLIIYMNGQALSKISYPLQHTDVSESQPELSKLGDIHRPELEAINSRPYFMDAKEGLKIADELLTLKKGQAQDPALLLSTAYVTYRFGRLTQTRQLLEMAPSSPDTDYLRGLLDWEAGKPVDFGQAGIDAHYHRAMLALQQGKKDQALRYLNELIEQRPGVYRPRLMKAYLTQDLKLARTLSQENPGSPEALLVMELLGDSEAGLDKAELMRHNTDIADHLEAFNAEITQGEWKFPRRYQLLVQP